ncbi:piggyBac transposable element-derived protein 4-like, partial [Stegodyphus dumicola]|uniref:piggyBac transposable element-derived protein 4-like n=1 Tax=Stegodyphus dumicola TaxID=202533 RepID=UPI0015A7EB52
DNNAFDLKVCNKKTYKIDSILNYLRNKFKVLYVPDKEISVDESLLLWKGRLSWKQYIPSKRSRFGVKLYKICESKSGYISDFIIYTGKDTQYGSNYPEEQGPNRIVLELCHDLLDKGYTLYLDNWYTSTDLAEKMCRRKTDVVGTMRKNRKGIPSDIKNCVLKKDEHIARYRDKIMIMKWKDKKDVIILSTIHDNKFVEIENEGKRYENRKLSLTTTKVWEELILLTDK